MGKRTVALLCLVILMTTFFTNALNAYAAGANITSHTHKWVEQTKVVHHDAVTKTVHHDEVTTSVHHNAETKIVHHEAVLEVVHYDEVGHYEEQPVMEEYAVCNHCGGDMTANFSDGVHQCYDGAWSGEWHTGYRQVGTTSVYVVDQEAYDETVIAQEDWDETVVVKEAYDEIIVITPAYDEKVTITAAYDEKVVTGYKCSVCGSVITSVPSSTLQILSTAVTDVSSSGYRVTISFVAGSGVKEVLFPTWTSKNGQDDIIWHRGTVSGDTASFYVKASDHKGEAGSYITHIYVYDKNGKRAAVKGVTATLPAAVVTSKSYVSNGVDYSLVFDAKYYLNKYSDLRAAFGTDEGKAFQHFLTYGMREGRQAKATFNVTTYRSRYADLRKAFGSDLKSYYIHYINYGYREGRKAN